LIEENIRGGYIERSEQIRIAVREFLRNESISLSRILDNIAKQNENIKFFDCCINCGKKLDTYPKDNHFFHKTNEIFILKFCCYCFKQFKDKTLDEFPEDLIEKIKEKVKKFKKSEHSLNKD
jgi:hypothetical protein